MNTGLFHVWYKQKRYTVEAVSSWAAKRDIIEKLKVSKREQGLVAVMSAKAYEREEFRFS